MSKTVEIASLSGVIDELLQNLEQGNDIIVKRDDKPIARLVPYQTTLDEIDIHPGIRTSVHVWKEPSGRVHLSKSKNWSPEA